MLVDTHNHLNFEAFDKDWEAAVNRASEAGVGKMIVVGTDIDTSLKAIAMAKQRKTLWATVGFHPHHVKALIKLPYARVQLAQITDQLKKMARGKQVVAVGECGLDYHTYQNSRHKHPDNGRDWEKLKDLQKQIFGMQIELARELKLPLVIHNREADMEVLDAIDHFCKKDGNVPRGVLHCISGSSEFLEKGLNMGFYIGVDGNVTYDGKVKALAKKIPLELLVVETDSPYLAPKPRRRLRNEPANVKIVAEFLAKLKNISREKLEQATTKNAERLFNLH